MSILTADATITSKGQVTIPKRIREQLDLSAGDQVEFVVSDVGELTVRRKRDPMDRLRDVRDTLETIEVDVADLRRQADREWSGIRDPVDE